MTKYILRNYRVEVSTRIPIDANPKVREGINNWVWLSTECNPIKEKSFLSLAEAKAELKKYTTYVSCSHYNVYSYVVDGWVLFEERPETEDEEEYSEILDSSKFNIVVLDEDDNVICTCNSVVDAYRELKNNDGDAIEYR